jgi:hypothetical protein
VRSNMWKYADERVSLEELHCAHESALGERLAVCHCDLRVVPAAGPGVVEQAAVETPRGCPHCGCPRMVCVALASFEGEDRVAPVMTSGTS